MALPVLFACTLFTSAFLLFLVQPLFAKMVLPLLGGAPAVWNTCMVFFQAALLAGYAWAHWSSRRLPIRWQVGLQVLLLGLALFTLPIHLPADSRPPTSGTPVFWLLWTLTVTVGLPFTVLATTAPLLQRWLTWTTPRTSKDPYYLYSASNAGSLSALLVYPLVFEPLWRLQTQAALWWLGFGICSVFVAACGILLLRSARAPAGGLLAPADHEPAPKLVAPAVLAAAGFCAVELCS